ncbi:YslB family protein [Levilactobacillus zymae]|uniref:YslB family protein n=1 Tax=Levilactobacillus zymae TaxID=267363 RepID=UPI0028B7551E|nr:YslB family protein [Levilactobacillus zymae]MDT6980945.1 YslB family protein [Levilactobacillus zymae]
MKNLYQTVMSDAAGAPYLPQLIIRDALIPELLGDDKGAIGYWAGKSLARKFPLGNPKDAAVFFQQVGFGTLTLLKQTAEMSRWQLSGEPVKLRKQLKADNDFTLEAGFLAEMMAQQLGISAEAELVETTRKLRNQAVTFDVYTDPSDVIPDYDAPTPLAVISPTTPDTPATDQPQ